MVLRPHNIPVTDSGSDYGPLDEPEQKTQPKKPDLPPLDDEPGKTGGTGGAGKTPTLEELFSEMLTRYIPETVSFTPMDEETIRAMLIGWLRPAYEQAIASRREQTARYNAELDADAWARGMGTSTYVTDVKERALTDEARDVSNLEGDYAATLASRLFSAMQEQQEQQLKVDEFNAEQINRAREQAADAAAALYQTYVRASRSSGGGKSTSTAAKTTGTAAKTGQKEPEQTKVGLDVATNLIARLSPEKRAELYAGKGAYAQIYREILDGIGMAAFRKLMQQYPAK